MISASCSARGRPRGSITSVEQSGDAGSLDSGSIAAVRDHNRDFGMGHAPLSNALGDGKKVRSPPGKQDSQTMYLGGGSHELREAFRHA